MLDKIKIAFFDVDGTLFNHSSQKMSRVTIDALKKLKENGIILCVATGRPMEMLDQLEDYIDEIGFEYFVTSNGQAIYHNNKLVYKNFLHSDDVKAIIKRAKKLDLAISVVGDGFNIVSKMNDTVRKACQVTEAHCPAVLDISDDFSKPVDHLICYESTSNMKHFASILKHSVMTHWSIDVFDFVPNNGVKVHGIKKVLKHLNLDAESSIAFGDGQNDLDMLKFVGFGVAMGNASLEVQEAADYVCEHINDDGVYHTLKRSKLI